jgi:hypothetical protein
MNYKLKLQNKTPAQKAITMSHRNGWFFWGTIFNKKIDTKFGKVLEKCFSSANLISFANFFGNSGICFLITILITIPPTPQNGKHLRLKDFILFPTP